MSENLFAEERLRIISDELRHKGRVSVRELSDLLAVSTVTIRNDLKTLERRGVLERTHGGAVLPQPLQSATELSFEIRQQRFSREKSAIGRAASDLIKNGDSIALDASTTAFAMLPYIKRFEKLIVVTNSIMVSHGLLDSPHIQVYMPGGRLRRDSIALVGQPETFININLNIGFFGARGISPQSGFTDTDPDEVAVKRKLVSLCQKTVVIVHHDKWEKLAPYSFVDIPDVDIIITTEGAPKNMVTCFKEKGIEILRVAVDQTKDQV